MTNEHVVQQILKEVKIDDSNKKDILIPTHELRINNNRELYSVNRDQDFYGTLSDTAIMHLFTKVNMPLPYMKKLMKERMQMVTDQFNFWIRTTPELRKINSLVRAVKQEDGTYYIRAVLSEKYAIIDNADLFEAYLAEAQTFPTPILRIEFLENTENTMYLRLIFPQQFQDYGTEDNPDYVYSGVDIVNSEVGYSSLIINPILYRASDHSVLRATKEEDILTCRHIRANTDNLGRLMCNSLTHAVHSCLNMQKALKKTKKTKLPDGAAHIKTKASKAGLTGKMTTLAMEFYEESQGETLFDALFAMAKTATTSNSPETRLKSETGISKLLYK